MKDFLGYVTAVCVVISVFVGLQIVVFLLGR